MVKTAGFRVIKTLEDFVWTPSVEIPQALTKENAETFTFIEKKENLIFMGAVGTGKTHLATAIALRACQNGKRAWFFTAASLANVLLTKNQKRTLNNFLSTLKKVELMEFVEGDVSIFVF